MFDFANTGRPMLFFTYHLVDYRDRLRGLYFDPARMPGPTCAPRTRWWQRSVTSRPIPLAHQGNHAASYRDFVAEFCAWDDGNASARFVERVFGSATTD